ncbi:YafY family transcriptional regulator [bacterium]|nr:YafY family transcriptional regulator [bacterium]MCB2201676.1 YafY family transcriptional regulator [bacterium]
MGMAKYDRLLHILNLLRTRRNLNAALLASECGVTERSIYRDILSLSEANVPVYYDNGYKLASDNFLPPLNFDFEEYSALKLALDSSPLCKTDSYRKILKRIRAKVEAGLSDVVKQKKKTAVDTTIVDIAVSVEPALIERYFAALERAVSESTQIEIVYDSVHSGLTKRTVEPYFIVFRGRAFYFVAYCRARSDFRTFRVDRIRELALTGNSFRRKPDIDPQRYFEGSWALHSGDPKAVEVALHGAAARVVRLARHHANESIETIGPDEVIYRVTVRGLDEIARWILGFGSDAEVLAPKELREQIARTVDVLARVYSKPRT